ncbi:MAG: maleylpyruvate isomerase N-terminal domain-containing protein [Actinomycetota bacterium]|nr:maleylpyruvate isomerase N-terminal domain-containing protein [Actinomycetota bacterium]
MLDLEPATSVLTDLVAGVGDHQLGGPTPCTKASLGDLLDHIDGLSMAFAAAAKAPMGPRRRAAARPTPWPDRPQPEMAFRSIRWLTR